MERQSVTDFLFAIATEIKRSFGSPVILLTMKDYSEGVFRSLMDMRTALLQKAPPRCITDIISEFHFGWLQAVQDIDTFKKCIRDMPRAYVSKAIDFTVESVKRRTKQFHIYINNMVTTMTTEENQRMQESIDIMSEMRDNFISCIRDKQKNFFTMVDPNEYYHKVLDETEELLNWLDTLNDNLALQFSKFADVKFPELASKLTKTLQEIVEEAASSTEPDAKIMAKELESRGRTLSHLVRLDSTIDDIEIREIIEKIKGFEDRIDRLKDENSSAVLALQHKAFYLGERLMSLENLRASSYALKNKCIDSKQQKCTHIFDHLLPPQERCRLVEDLVKLWTDSLCYAQECRSIISILSVADIKEVFSDELGKFTLDKYGRKLYKGNDGNIYQLNEANELVALRDDEKNVYFYDECGRYFLNERRERIYKASDAASEYCMNDEGVMLKIKEYRNKKEYWYDNLGRYYLNEKGKRIYCDKDGKIYENDGLGNLVLVRNDEDMDYVECPVGPIVTEESKYLQNSVGAALKKCIAAVVVCQPADPVVFLAKSLEDHRYNEQARQSRVKDEVELMAEREERMRNACQASTAPASLYSGELSYADSNFYHYQHTID